MSQMKPGRRSTSAAGGAGEAIPLNDYSDRGESLRKIHAQSSAETSGLGDSLQRIHALSSTETSGYGDTVGLPSPTALSPSPDRSYPRSNPGDPNIYSAGGRAKDYTRSPGHCTPTRQDRGRTVGTGGGGRDYPHTNLEQEGHDQRQRQQHHQAGGERGKAARAVPVDSWQPRAGARAQQAASRRRASTSSVSVMDSEVARYMDRPRRASHDTSPANTPSLSRSNSIQGAFLGMHSESAWLKWSQERRTSFKRRMDSIEQRQKEMERTRVSTPVRKARKESVMFVSPEMEGRHIADLDLPNTHPKLVEHFPAMQQRRRDAMHDPSTVKLTVNQWGNLMAFWEHGLFVRFRYIGVALSFIGFLHGILGIVNPSWSTYQGKSLSRNPGPLVQEHIVPLEEKGCSHTPSLPRGTMC